MIWVSRYCLALVKWRDIPPSSLISEKLASSLGLFSLSSIFWIRKRNKEEGEGEEEEKDSMSSPTSIGRPGRSFLVSWTKGMFGPGLGEELPLNFILIRSLEALAEEVRIAP